MDVVGARMAGQQTEAGICGNCCEPIASVNVGPEGRPLSFTRPGRSLREPPV
jgi:hypothetical protein